ncbi:50S ribosomal protein L23 [Candidatus Saccharibacteria bacterium]|nr:50S ribosomal protein L23 [Candidatus Saccharibacteria bacterium]
MTSSLKLRPIMSEKAYSLSQSRNTFVFAVPKKANRSDIAEAVRQQYSAEIQSVRLAGVPGKSRAIISRRRRLNRRGRTTAVRKAYVTLKTGSSLPIFAAAEAADKKAAEAKVKEKS